MSTTIGKPSAVRDALVAEAVALTEAHGADRVSLREVQRRVGVSPAAAYKHYRGRDELLAAVGRRASALLADAITQSTDTELEGEEQLRAGCRAYITFALNRPGLFRSILLSREDVVKLSTPDGESIGLSGRGPYELLEDALSLTPGATARDAPPIWAACHGLATLLLDGPLRHLTAAERNLLIEHTIDLLTAGIAANRPTPGAHRVRD